MVELLRILATRLLFFLDPHRYEIVGSGGTGRGNAYIDLRKGDFIWRLVRERGQITIELRFRIDRDYPSYSTDILKRWLFGERDDAAALLSDDVVGWLRQHLGEIESAVEEQRAETAKAWEELKRQRAKELFG